MLDTSGLGSSQGNMSVNKKKADAFASAFFMERVTRLELATSTLARWRSTG